MEKLTSIEKKAKYQWKNKIKEWQKENTGKLTLYVDERKKQK